MNDPFSLLGKKILITGASSGIGREVSIQCSRFGAEIYLSGRNMERLNETLTMLDGNGHSMLTADLINEDNIVRLAEDLPSLDGLVLNAAMLKTAPVKFIQGDYIHSMFKVNVESSMLLIKHLLKAKNVNDNASICFISSISSQYVHHGNSVYSATKGAINSFAKSLALELAPKKIRVNAILPGMVETSILNNGVISDEQLKEHVKDYPIGRFGKPEDIAYLCVYLLSRASGWMTGSLLTIDGGYSLR